MEAPGHRFGERESGDVFEKPNGRRNRIVIRMAEFFGALSSLRKINILSLPAIIPGSLRPTLFGRQGIETAPIVKLLTVL